MTLVIVGYFVFAALVGVAASLAVWLIRHGNVN